MANKVYNWLFKNKDGKVVIGQWPNWQISVAAVFWLVQFAFSDGPVHSAARAGFIIMLTVWAYEEIVNGVNGFRRILGLVVMSTIFLELYRLFESMP